MATILPAVHFRAGSAASGTAARARPQARRAAPQGRHRRRRVEPEGRVAVCHQPCVRGDSEDPAVETEHEVEDPSRVAGREQQCNPRNEDEHGDQPWPPRAVIPPDEPAAPADEDRHDHVLRDYEQPPLDEDEPFRQPFRVVDLELRRIVSDLVQREGRIAIGAQRPVGVEDHSPGPAEHADVEVEDPTRVAAREEDREERDDAHHHERRPQEEEHDEGIASSHLTSQSQRLSDGSSAPSTRRGYDCGAPVASTRLQGAYRPRDRARRVLRRGSRGTVPVWRACGRAACPCVTRTWSLARGGMADVYRARDSVLGRVVAIKMLAERYAADDEFRARFTREALTAASLSIPMW